jgi:hypothetical protein
MKRTTASKPGLGPGSGANLSGGKHSSAELTGSHFAGKVKGGIDGNRPQHLGQGLRKAVAVGRPAVDTGWLQESGRSARQFSAILHAESAQQGRDVKFDGADSDVKPRRDLLVRVIANHRMKDLFLSGTQRGRASDGSSFVEKILGPRKQPARQRLIGGDQDFKVLRIRPAREALHGQQPRQAFDGEVGICLSLGSKLSRSCRSLAEHEKAGLVEGGFLAANKLRQFAHFLQSGLPVLPWVGRASFWFSLRTNRLQAGLLRTRELL